MKRHKILKTFAGSQTGLDYHRFEAGSEADLSDDLAAIAVREGWADPLVPAAPAATPPKAETRETKVIEPAETKVEEMEEIKAAEVPVAAPLGVAGPIERLVRAEPDARPKAAKKRK